LVAHDVPAQNILALSFSNASVGELRCRLAGCDVDLSQVRVSTAHAFALGLIPRRQVLTDKQSLALIGRAIRSVQRDCRKEVLWPSASPATRLRRVQQLDALPAKADLVLRLFEFAAASRQKVSQASALGQFESLAACAKILSAVGSRFAKMKARNNLIDYGDMLVQAVEAIQDRPVPFTHILVDEYQDCSPAQAHLLAQLAALEGRSIMVFGDADQAVFGFAGATYTPLSDFVPGVENFSLRGSRRLSRQTATLASAVAGHSSEQAIQAFHVGKVPVLAIDTSLHRQLRRMVRDIQHLIDLGTPPGEIVVLARVKALLTPVEQALLAKGVLTKRIGTRRRRRHALRVLRLVRLVERYEMSGTEATRDQLRTALPNVKVLQGSDCKRELQDLKKASRAPSLEGRYRLCAKTYVRLMGGHRQSKELRADINRWEPVCRKYGSAREMSVAVREIDGTAVVTGTIHSAKGREWDHVLITGATDGYLPLYLARDKAALDEERRLLYVAITRARQDVRLYHAPAEHARSRKRFENVSRLLDDPAVRKAFRVV
jgi:DNA helicase-2/ATP-dependent DNA helicase PcrA